MNEHSNGYLIAKANKLIEAAYRLSLAEQCLLLAVIAQIDSRPMAKDEVCLSYEVAAADLADLFDIPLNQSYELLRDAADRLAERWVTIERPDPDTPTLAYTRTRWISAIDYLPSEGRLRVFLSPKILPYLTQLAGEFARYKLKYVSAMTSVYAIRLYELLIQWQMQGEREVPVEWLKDRFAVPDCYARLYDLKRRVIEPAIEQINAYSNLWVRWSQRKQGRNVVAFHFEFGLKDRPAERTLSSDPATRVPTRAEIEQQARPGESWDDARERLCRERGG